MCEGGCQAGLPAERLGEKGGDRGVRDSRREDDEGGRDPDEGAQGGGGRSAALWGDEGYRFEEDDSFLQPLRCPAGGAARPLEVSTLQAGVQGREIVREGGLRRQGRARVEVETSRELS